MELDESIAKAASLIQEATCAVALTGAGISTPSGVPDFRSHDSGLWTHANPMEVASLQGFRYKPAAFYEWIRPLAKLILAATPNPAHHAIARMQSMGILKSVITQNIDLLHSQAGSENVYEVHGHIRELTCIECMTVYAADDLLPKFLENDDPQAVLRCAACQGVLKPNVILFGEQLPMSVMIKARQEVKKADLLLVVGSSLEVYPVADFPRQVKSRGGKVILLNLTPTFFDDEADLVIHADCADFLPQVVGLLEGS